ncbi:hypothetical protein [Azonexus sp.]|uniref:hypothetical protein n=1 Tax=Azonexus sp. TaxID=1872668 RepID=UPI0035B29BE9
MWRVFLFVLVGLFVSACAGNSAEHSDEPLHNAYLRYRQAVLGGSVLAQRAEIFSPAVLEDIDIASEQEVKVLMWGGAVVREHSHYEKKLAAGRGCLTVNGYADDAGKPVSLFIEYDGHLVRFQHLDFPDRARFDGFITKALCPDEAYEEIMRRSSASPS